jgi:hypothetical protein
MKYRMEHCKAGFLQKFTSFVQCRLSGTVSFCNKLTSSFYLNFSSKSSANFFRNINGFLETLRITILAATSLIQVTFKHFLSFSFSTLPSKFCWNWQDKIRSAHLKGDLLVCEWLQFSLMPSSRYQTDSWLDIDFLRFFSVTIFLLESTQHPFIVVGFCRLFTQ